MLGFYCSVTFIQEILFALKTHNELSLEKPRLTKELVGKALKELVAKYMHDFKDNTYSKEVEKEKYRLKEAAEEI